MENAERNKRPRPVPDAYGGNGYQPSKKQRPNDHHSSNGHGHGAHRPHSNANGLPVRNSTAEHRAAAHRDKTNVVHHHLDHDFPQDTKDCWPCKRSASDMQTGLAALLDHFILDESANATRTGPDQISKDILHHARALQMLLTSRASRSLPSQTLTSLDSKRPETEPKADIPHIHSAMGRKIELCKDLPPMPPISSPHLLNFVFTHSSANDKGHLAIKGYRAAETNYEHLEFLGDAYIEVVATRLIYSRFPDLEVSQQAYFREQLVRNESLGKFGAAYGLGDRLKHAAHQVDKTGRTWTKVLADVFEAYCAAIVLDDPISGFERLEQWLTELWAPVVLAYTLPPVLENPRARDDLNVLVMAKGIKLTYKEEKPFTQISGRQRFFMGVYLTGWGFEDEWLGSGEGQNKQQACVFAAMDALNGRARETVVNVANKRKLEVYPPKTAEEREREKVEKEEKKRAAERNGGKGKTEEKKALSKEKDGNSKMGNGNGQTEKEKEAKGSNGAGGWNIASDY